MEIRHDDPEHYSRRNHVQIFLARMVFMRRDAFLLMFSHCRSAHDAKAIAEEGGDSYGFLAPLWNSHPRVRSIPFRDTAVACEEVFWICVYGIHLLPDL